MTVKRVVLQHFSMNQELPSPRGGGDGPEMLSLSPPNEFSGLAQRRKALSLFEDRRQTSPTYG